MKKVDKKYFKNTYLSNTESVITDIGKDEHGVWVRLSSTIFHPQGGGQPYDTGFINKFKVINVQHVKDIGEVNHYIEISNINDLEIGKKVEIQIDMERRAKNASLHTAGHFIANVISKELKIDLQTPGNAKGHHYPNESKVEFKVGKEFEVDKDKISKLILNAFHVSQKQQTEVFTLFDIQNNRTMKIGEHEAVGCGGTHISSIDQIESLTIRGINKKKDVLNIGYDACPNLELFLSKKSINNSEKNEKIITDFFKDPNKNHEKSNKDEVIEKFNFDMK